MLRKAMIVLAIVGSGLGASVAAADPPVPDPNFAGTVIPVPCEIDQSNPFELRQADAEGWADTDYVRYGTSCQRMRFAFGPIHIKPGQNDVLIEPVTIQKPTQDGYITRIAPDLVRADGSIPNIEELHLHHGTWLNLTDEYGSGPFFASGEEKTVANFPRGYGMPVKTTDQWQLLYMVHNQLARADEVWITYTIDFVAASTPAAAGIKPVYPIWLDVRPSTYPVFNTQRSYGSNGECTWPNEQCAAFDPFGRVIHGQGSPGTGTGTPWRFPAAGRSLGRLDNFQGGTLIGIGGHLHPGGKTVNIDLERSGKSKRIFTSEAWYWDRTNRSQRGGLEIANSWDLSMTVTGLPRWAIRVEPNDILRISATYDTTLAATYENMGIAVALFAPDVHPGHEGLNPFTAPSDTTAIDWNACFLQGVLCDKGEPTHGHLAEAENYGGPDGSTSLGAPRGNPTDRVDIAGFFYLPGDHSLLPLTGVPTVPMGSSLRFTNADMGANIYHTVTSCKYPCRGSTGIAFPVADGRSSTGTMIDFDSAELGYGPPIGPARNSITWDLQVTPENGFEPGAEYTYFCRVHPFMRGAFAVAPEGE